MPCKMTIFFNMFGGGFSETFYHPNDDPFNLAGVTPNSLYQLAAKFRYVGCIIKAVRFSRVGGQRRSILVRPYPKAQGTRFSALDPGPDPISTTAVYNLYSTGQAKRNIWCRGLADLDIKRDAFGNDEESATLQQMRNEYFQALFTAGFRIQFLQRPPDAGLVWRKIAQINHSVSVDPNRASFIPSVAAPALAVGDVLSVTGVPSNLPHFPRKFEIISITAVDGVNNYTFAYQLPGGVSVGPKNMRVTPYVVTYENISQWNFVRFGEHKTGRPFGSLRGRARAAVSLR